MQNVAMLFLFCCFFLEMVKFSLNIELGLYCCFMHLYCIKSSSWRPWGLCVNLYLYYFIFFCMVPTINILFFNYEELRQIIQVSWWLSTILVFLRLYLWFFLSFIMRHFLFILIICMLFSHLLCFFHINLNYLPLMSIFSKFLRRLKGLWLE